MPQQDPIKPGQVTSIPQSTYDPNKEAGRVINNLPNVAPPVAPNLLFDNTAPTTPNGTSKVNPAYALYINTLKSNNAKQAFLSTPYYTPLAVTERYSDNELGGYHPYDMNLENWYGDNQSWLDQWGNRLGKFGTKIVGSFANSLMDIPNMINATKEGNIDKMWDNPVNNWATDLMDWSEKNMPNYETNWEREHPFANLIPFYGNSGNGWGKVVENLGFTIGAVGGAVVEDIGIGMLTGGVGEIPVAAMQINKAVYKLGKLINSGEGAFDALKASIKTADDIVAGLKGIDRFNYALRKGLWGANMITSGVGEAAFEGVESYRNLSKDLQQQFLEENSRMPGYEDLRNIDTLSRDAGNSRFLLNSALLAVTNSIQWGNLLRPLEATKGLIQAEAKEGVRVALKQGSRDLFEAIDQSSKLAKWGKKLTGNTVAQSLIGSGSEGFEEGAQYAIETGVNDFYKRKYDDKNITTTNNFLKSFSTGLSETMGTKEGWENIVYGLLGGAMYKGGEYAYYKAKGIDPNPNYKKQIDTVIKGLNGVSLTGIFENKYGSAVQAISIQEDLQQAAATGNIFQYKNFKHDQFVEFVLSGIKQNKFDTRIEQLQELKKLDSQEFEKTFGIPSSTENKKTVDEYVNKLEQNANYMKDIHKRVSRTFINPFTYKGTGNYKNKEQALAQDIENEQYLKYEEVKDDLVRAMSISKDSADRVKPVREQIAATQSVVDPSTVVRLSSQEGLKDLKKEYKEKAKLAEESLKLASDPKTKKDAKWYNDKIAEIDEILNSKDANAQNVAYNKFVNDVFDRTQKENNIVYNISGTEAQRAAVNTPFPRDVIKDVISLGQDIYHLQKRNEIAIDRYARLTTKDGFKSLFDEIGELRKQAAALQVPLQAPVTQGQAAQQQTAFNAAQAQQGQAPTAQPQAAATQTPAQTPAAQAPTATSSNTNQQQGYTEDLGIQTDAEEERMQLLGFLVDAAEGRKKFENVELEILGFKIIDDLKFDNPNLKVDDYIRVKSTTGANFYISKDVVATAKQILANSGGASATSSQGGQEVPPVTPTTPPPTNSDGGLRTGDFMAKIFVPQDLKIKFNDAIFSGTKDEIRESLSISIKSLSPELQAQYDQQVAQKSYTPVKGFPGIFVAKSPIDISAWFNPGGILDLDDNMNLLSTATNYDRALYAYNKAFEIGKIAYPKRLLFKIGNDFVTIDKLSPEQYQQFTGKPAAQHAADVEEFNKQVAFTNYLAQKFKNNGFKETALTSAETEELLDIVVTYGELDLITHGDRPLYSALKHNTVALPLADGSTLNTMVILSIPKRFSADKMVRERTNFMTPIYGQNFYDNANADDAIMLDFINSSSDAILKIGSRYVGVITKPDGSFALVALRPAEMEIATKNIVFQSLKARAAESVATNFVLSTKEESPKNVLYIGDKEVYYKLPSDEAKNFNDEFNNDINSRVFISDPNGRVFFDLTLSPIGAIRLDIHEPISGYRNRVVIAPQKVEGLDSFQAMIDVFNKEIEKKEKNDTILKDLKVKIASNNFREGIADDSSIPNAETLAGSLTTSTSIEVFKNGTMKLVPNSGNVQTAFNKEKGSTTKSTIEQTAQGAPAITNPAQPTSGTLFDQLQAQTPGGIANIDQVSEINKRRKESLKEQTTEEFNNEIGWFVSSEINGSKGYAGYYNGEEILANTKEDLFRKIDARYDAEIDAITQAPQTTQGVTSLLQQGEQDYGTLEDVFGPQVGTGMFSGLSNTPVDKAGQPAPIETAPQNQEDLQDMVFASVKEALNAADIDYRTVNDTTQFFTMSSGEILDLPGLSPKDLADSMNLKVVLQQKSFDSGLDFMRSTEVGTLNNLMNLENARAYISSILPSFIKVEELDSVMDRIREQGIENPEQNIWGAFKDGIIYLNKQAPSVGQEYHEAFHAVFNLFVSPEEQQKLIAEAKNGLYADLKKQGTSIRDYITNQRKSGIWTNISDTQAVEKASEEWMAEKFRNWKNKKKDAGPLQKLFSLIERFFKWLLRSGSDLDALFNKIDTGGYKYSNIVSNSFTQDTTDENTTQEFKFMLIPARPTTMAAGKGTLTINRSLDPKTSKQVVQKVAAYFEMYKKTGEFSKLTDEQLLNQILDDLKLTYSPKNAAYAGMSQEQLNTIAKSDENFIYTDEKSRDIIKDSAKKYISSMNYFEQFADDELTDQEDITGQPSTGYDNKSENVGGFSSLPGMLRHYIGFTSYEVKDRFGNATLANGKPVIATVDAVSVYYGLLRATANIHDPVKFFQRMIRFSDNNEQSRHFVEKFIKDTGLNQDVLFGENRIEASKNKALVEQVKKGFNKYRIDYIFTEYDHRKGKYRSYHANRRNVENVQFDKWSNSFIAGYSEMSPENQANIRKAIDNVRNRYFDERRAIKRTAEETRAIVNEVKSALAGVGIQMSFDYIRYSLLSINAKRFDDLNKEYKDQGAELQFDDPQNKFISKLDYSYVQIMKIADEITLNRDFMDELSKVLNSDANPYFRRLKDPVVDEESGKVIEDNEGIDTAMVTRMLSAAKGNALFDETVGESSFTNADNKVVFAHQDGTFNVKFSYQLKDVETRRRLREDGVRDQSTAITDGYDSEWLTDNHLLKSADFEAVADNLMFQNIDGIRAVETNKLDRVITQEFRDQKEGVTYGSYSPREFFINNLNFYISYANVQKTPSGDVITTPHLIRVLEASKTANTVSLPVNLDVFREGTVTEKTLGIMLNEVTKEYNRIQRVQNEVGKLTNNVVENYHTGSFAEDGFTITKGYRGLQFTDNITSLITKATADLLQRKARTGQELSEEDKNTIKQEVKASLNKMVDDTINLLAKEGMIKVNPKGAYDNVLLHRDFFVGNKDLNLQSVDSNVKFKTNIGHVIINDYINTLAYNQILHGDSALSLKNDGGIDAVKRAKGDNAAITSIRTDLTAPELGITEVFTHSNVAIFKEPVAVDGTKIADAQMYTTIKGLRYSLWGLGRLSPRLAKFLDALERGDDIHALVDDKGKVYDGVFDDDNGLLRWDEMTNSLKLVYKDGKTYFKMSVVVLQPNLTAYKNEQGEWKTIPGWETLDNLRRKMEADGIHFAAPESASKMMTLDVSKAKDFSDLKGHLFDNNYFGLQTENPSNKLEITTPTQLLQLIDSEQNDAVEVYLNGAKTNVGNIKAIYQDAVSQKVTNSYDGVLNEIYDITDFNNDIDKLITDGKVLPRLQNFYKRVASTLEASGSDAQLLDFFSLDENGNVRFNANLSAVKTKSQQLYLSYFSKGVLSQKSPGYTVALMSGIDTKTMRIATRVENGQVTEWEHVRRDQWDSNRSGVRNMQIRSKAQVTEVGQLFTDELQHMVAQYNENGEVIGHYSEMMLPAHFAELLGLKPGDEIPEAIAWMFGVRIPSQDKHSFISLRLVDFLPANLGSTGMFPKDLIALSGADFDIDKLFITRYDFYMTKDKNGKIDFKKYGSATSERGKWSEYKRWMLENSKPIKNAVRDILLEDATYQSLKDEQQVLRELQMEEVFADAGKQLKKELYDKAVSQAFKTLKLPSTVEEFTEVSKTRELNNGVLNNRILDSYRALLTNDGMRQIANTPATLTALIELKDADDITLKDKEGNKIASVFGKKTSYPVDSMIGQYYGFKNNTTGKDNIGIDVNANLIYSVLNKGNVKLEDPDDLGNDIGFMFDGQHFVSFAGDREYNLKTGQYDGKRTNDIISTLITAATDEAKEQLNALYNLTVDALKVVNYLVALKVPLKTAIYFVNQPSIRNYLDVKAVKQNTIQTVEEEKLFRDTFREEAVIRTRSQIKDYTELSDDEMFSMFESNGIIEVVC